MATLPDPIDHRAEAERALGGKAWTPGEHLLAAIHDLLDQRLPKPEGSLEPMCSYGLHVGHKSGDALCADTEGTMPTISTAHSHPPTSCEVPGCPECEPETVTVTLPRAVVEYFTAGGWRGMAHGLRDDRWVNTADLLDALADALDGQR